MSYENRLHKLTLVLLLLLAGSGGCVSTSSKAVSERARGISRFVRVSDTVYRGRLPRQSGWDVLSEKGIIALIDLRELDKDERRRFATERERQGFTYFSFPTSLEEPIDEKQALEFLAIMSNEMYQPAFVFCETGKEATGAYVALYRVAREQWTPADAYREAKRFGLWPVYVQIKDFILNKTAHLGRISRERAIDEALSTFEWRQ